MVVTTVSPHWQEYGQGARSVSIMGQEARRQGSREAKKESGRGEGRLAVR